MDTTLRLKGEFLEFGTAKTLIKEIPIKKAMSRELALQIALSEIAKGESALKRLFIVEIPTTQSFSDGTEMCTLWTAQNEWVDSQKCGKWWRTLICEISSHEKK